MEFTSLVWAKSTLIGHHQSVKFSNKAQEKNNEWLTIFAGKMEAITLPYPREKIENIIFKVRGGWAHETICGLIGGRHEASASSPPSLVAAIWATSGRHGQGIITERRYQQKIMATNRDGDRVAAWPPALRLLPSFTTINLKLLPSSCTIPCFLIYSRTKQKGVVSILKVCPVPLFVLAFRRTFEGHTM